MITATKPYAVGQTLCAAIIGHAGRKCDPKLVDITVTKVGRRWVEFRTEPERYLVPTPRFDAASGQIDSNGYSDIGTVYPSREAYLAKVERDGGWEWLRRCLRDTYAVPDRITTEAIKQACTLLGFPEPPPKE